MGKLIYAANISLDGFLEDETGSFDWSVPDEDVHAFWNEHERHIGTSLYGRRMYETMRVWESDDWLTDEPSVVREYADIWRAADKIVYSSTLDAVAGENTTIERVFDPESFPTATPARSSCSTSGVSRTASSTIRPSIAREEIIMRSFL